MRGLKWAEGAFCLFDVHASPMTSKRSQSRRREAPLVYCSIRHSGLKVTELASEELGFRFTTLPVDLPRSRLVLGLHEHEMPEIVPKLRSTATVGRLPGADSATDKATTEEFRSLSRMLDPMLFSEGFPETWLLPRDMCKLQAAMEASPRQPYILKPRNSSEGNGIRLLLSISDVGQRKDDAVVQRYVDAPLLVDGLKFDLRLYVLVKQLKPLEIWMCREGLVRLCTDEYETPSKKNMHNVTAHLTNYSLNKRAPRFVHTEDEHGAGGSKRSLSSMLPTILEALPGVDEDELWTRLSSVTIRGMLPLVPFLLDADRQHRQGLQSGKSRGPHLSQLFGVDLLLDRHGMPWFLEVNSFPSLSINCTVPFSGEGKCCRCMDDYKPHVHAQSAVDHHVKLCVVRGALQLLMEHYGKPLDSDDGTSSAAVDATTATFENGTSTKVFDGPASFIPLVLDGAMIRVLDVLSQLAESFGGCCKRGSAFADPFRLRKVFTALGVDEHQVDFQVRQLAQQQDGLSLLAVARSILDGVVLRTEAASLTDALTTALQETPSLIKD